MESLSKGLGPFSLLVPVIAGLLCLAMSGYALVGGQASVAAILVAWFGAAYAVSIQDFFFASLDGWSSTSIINFVAFASLPVALVVLFFLVYGCRQGFRDYIQNRVEAWLMVFLHVYRIAGSCFLYLYIMGTVENYTVLQAGILDLFIGVTAIPVALIVKNQGIKHSSILLYIWNFIGLYDLAGAFVLCGLDFLGIYPSSPSLTLFGFYPISLIVLFPIPVAIITHILFLTQQGMLLDSDKARYAEI